MTDGTTDGQVHVVTAEGKILWCICSRGSCLVHRNLRRLMEAYHLLKASQDKEAKGC
jgi:hypothetical protein